MNAGAIAGKIRKPLHAHGVGEDQAFEPHLLTQQRVHDGRRQGGGLGFGAVQSRNVQVRNHDCPHAAFEGVGKRGELHAVQTCPVVGNGRQRGVRVAVAVAVPGEVLGCGQDMDVLKAVGVSLPHFAHERHVLPEASAPDYGVDGVGIHVDDGGKVHVHACGAKALPHHLTKHPNQRWVAGRAQRHRSRKGTGRIQPHAQPPFGV